MVKVSVIVPVYNAGEYLRPCLDTLVNQTLREIEIICVLDCPTDGSDKIVDEYAALDNRVVVVRNEHNLNIGESRNVGIRHANGIYIGFSDHDDLHELNMYQELWNASDEGKRDMVLSGPMAKYCNSNASWSMLFCSFLGRRSTTHITPHIYRRQFIEEKNLHVIDNNVCSIEDTLFNLSFLDAMVEKENFMVVPSEFYHHRDSGSNTNLGYSHWAFNKVEYAVELAASMAEKNKMIGLDVHVALYQLAVKCFYTSFLRERKKNGLFHTLSLFRELKRKGGTCASLFSSMPIALSGLSLPKRLFLLFLKTCGRNPDMKCGKMC